MGHALLRFHRLLGLLADSVFKELYLKPEALLFVRHIDLIEPFAVDLVLQTFPTHLFNLGLSILSSDEIVDEITLPVDICLLKNKLSFAEIEFELLKFTLSRWPVTNM